MRKTVYGKTCGVTGPDVIGQVTDDKLLDFLQWIGRIKTPALFSEFDYNN